MQTNEELELMQCRTLLKQTAWRLQYYARRQTLKEIPMLYADRKLICYFDDDIISTIYVQELMDTIVSEKCRYIIQKTVLEGITETAVASDLHISQQGVSKWKKKGMEVLKNTLTHS